MRKILIELQIDWEGYEDVSDELIIEDAIEARVEGVGWTLLRQPLVSGEVCDNCGEGKPSICSKCYETESNFRESY